MKIVCAWCEREGRPSLLAEQPPLDDGIVSHGICARHQRAALAELPSRSFPGVRLLVVVSRREEPLCEYLIARLTPVRGTAVILDRRHSERRQRREPAAVERRQAERRRPRAEASLLGYMLVRFGELPQTRASESGINL